MADEPGSRVEVLVDSGTVFDDLDNLSALVTEAAETALDSEHLSGPDSVTVLLSNDRKLRELNRQFNGDDSVTDVLSFNDVEGWHNGVPPADLADARFVMPGEVPRLGEVVISLEQAARQAGERSVAVEREVAMLAVHGVLHLLGYDHADPDEEQEMFGKTDDVLARVFSG